MAVRFMTAFTVNEPSMNGARLGVWQFATALPIMDS
jgi:hypothetical protein